MNAPEKPRQRIAFEYRGRREGGKGTAALLFQLDRELDEDEPGPGYWSGRMAGHLAARFTVGDIISIEVDERGSAYYPTARFVSHATAPPEAVRTWTLADRAWCTESKARGARKGRDELRLALEPIRDAYASATGSNRAAMLAEIISMVTSRGPLIPRG